MQLFPDMYITLKLFTNVTSYYTFSRKNLSIVKNYEKLFTIANVLNRLADLVTISIKKQLHDNLIKDFASLKRRKIHFQFEIKNDFFFIRFLDILYLLLQ